MRRREERSRFFQILLADFSQRLCIPSKFLANLKGNLPETVELRNASERRWRVRVRNIGSATYLEEGWSEFAASESLQQCDFLTFTFDGKSCFRVLVFGPNGCEKWDTVNEDKSRAAVVSREMETEARKRKKNSEKTERSEALVVNEARDRALKFAAQLGPSSPHFLAVMKPSHLHGKSKMGIARRFADEFLSGKTRTVILKSLGKEWEVRYVVSGERRRRFGTGWGRFADDNKLHLGDALVFQLTNQRNSVSCLNVRIFRFHEKLPLPSL